MTSTPLAITNASVPAALMGEPTSGALNRVDIAIADGLISSIAPAGTAPFAPGERIDLDAGLVLPCLVDMHTHLDKGHIWPRKENPDGSWFGALTAVLEDREANWAAGDVERRMDFALRCAWANGTAAIRTHLDSAPPQHEITMEVFQRVKSRWAGRVELQGVSLIGPDTMLDVAAFDAVAKATKAAGCILGGSVAVHPEARDAVFAAVEKAGELGMDLDLHIDETLEVESSALRHLADAVIETGFTGKVVAGHCCVLSVQDERVAQATIDRVAEAGVNIVSMPICNMYLMDRQSTGQGARTPRYRGVTLVNEFRAAGVEVAIASDNTRDPFYAYGDLDMVEVFREGARIIHFDHPQSAAWSWIRAVSSGAAATCGFAHSGTIAVGQPADLLLFRARSWTELNARPQSNRTVLRGGQRIDTTPPDYRELDDLMG